MKNLFRRIWDYIKQNRYSTGLIIIILISFFAGIGQAALFDEDEGAFSEATREMIVSGDYISTTVNQKPRYDKPILIYWLMAASAKIFGLNEFAMRFPSALASLFWAVSLFHFTRVLFDEKRAFFATFFMVTSLHISFIAKSATADALLNVFLANSMFQLFYWFKNGKKKHIWYFFLFCGLGTLTKGPVSILIPGAVSLLFALIYRKFTDLFRLVFNPVGLLIFCLIALPWYIIEYSVNGNDFIEGFFMVHNINRFSSSMENHAGSLFFYIPVVILALMPYPKYIFSVFARVKKYFEQSEYGFLISWFLFVFLFFSLSGTKLPHYTIYGYTPLFILFSDRLGKTRKSFSFYPIAGLFFVVILFIYFIPQIRPLVEDVYGSELIGHVHDLFFPGRFLLVAFSLVLLVFMGYRIKQEEVKILVAGFFTVILINLMILPVVNKVMQEPVKEAALMARENSFDVVFYKHNVPSFLFYYQSLTEKKTPETGDIVFTKSCKLQQFSDAEVLYEKYGLSLAYIRKK